MSWTSLKNGIATVIKTNGNQEITGNALQGVLNSMVNALGAHATFAGMAIPSTSPGTPDGPVFYLALQAGSYPNFGATPFIVSEGEFGIFVWDGTTWSTLKYTPGANLSEIVSELNALRLKIEQIAEVVGGVEVEVQVDLTNQTNFRWVDGHSIFATGASEGTSTNSTANSYAIIDVSQYQGKKIHFSNRWVIASSTDKGAIFYTSDYENFDSSSVIPGSGILFYTNAQESSIKDVEAIIPATAKTMAITFLTEAKENFYCYALDTQIAEGLTKDVEDLQEDIDNIKSDIGNESGLIPHPLDLSSGEFTLFAFSPSYVVYNSRQARSKIYEIPENADFVKIKAKTTNTTVFVFLKAKPTGTSNISYEDFKANNLAVYADTPSTAPYYTIVDEGDTTDEIQIPSNALYLMISNRTGGGDNREPEEITFYEEGNTIYSRIKRLEGKSVISSLLSPRLERGGFTEIGKFYSADADYIDYIRTSRYIVCNSSTIKIKSSIGCNARVFNYNSAHSCISYNDITLIASTDYEYQAISKYIKIVFDADGVDLDVVITGAASEELNERPSNGIVTLCVPVEVSSPTSCDEQTDSLQDTKTMLCDYGVFMLPSTYRHYGQPTRLIIYCHGAGGHYTGSSVEFSGIEPDYWLAEGYAVMDMEGNPFDNTNDHFCMPEARKCYVSAYNWVVANYNICADGVFLGGRSMGGYMTAELMRSNIPIIAACPSVPVFDLSFAWLYMSSTRRAFCAQRMGLTNPPTWTSSKPMSSDEWNFLKDNFNKIKNFNPWFSFIEDLPSKDVLFADSLNKALTASNGETLLDIYSGLKLKFPVPVKLFAASADSSVIPEYNWKSLKAAAENACNIFECRVFVSNSHHYELDDDNRRTTITTRFGELLTDIPIVYVEELMFWRRYEQRN